RYLDGVVALNALIIERLKKTFPFAKAQYLVGPSGVDPALFRAHDRSEARRHIDVEEGMPIVMYTGRFIAWKGLEIIPEAAGLVSDARWYMVGGTREQFEKLTKAKAPANMVFVEHVPQQDISWWLAAADVLLVLGTKRDPLSFSYTSPMKLFEYLLSERPIIASDTPAIRQAVSEQEVIFYEPDNAESLAEQVRAALLQTGGVREKIGHARVKGEQFSWKGRAQRILQLISEHYDSKGSTVASHT
ncbi:MAG TPA: glycosyltransferase family 4 protein, partial [Candidatus Paceibacterota bacterium]